MEYSATIEFLNNLKEDDKKMLNVLYSRWKDKQSVYREKYGPIADKLMIDNSIFTNTKN